MFPSKFSYHFNQDPEDYRSNIMRGINFPSNDDEEDPNPYSSLNTANTASQPTDFMSLYRELANRQNGPAMQSYRKFLSEEPVPDRAQNEPGKLRKLAAVLAGAGIGYEDPAAGIRTGKDIIDSPYEDAVAKWKLKEGQLEKAASIENTFDRSALANVKLIGDLKNTEEDNQRAGRLADSTIATNAARAKAAGQKVIKDEVGGHIFIVNADGTKSDLGKLSETPDEKSKRTINQAIGIEGGRSPIIEGREKRMSGIKFGQEVALEDKRQVNREKLEDKRASNREELTKTRMDAAQKRLETRLNQKKDPSITQRIKTNTTKVESMLKANPELEKFWDSDKGDLASAPSHDSEDFPAWLNLYNTLYSGINEIQTPSGNRIIRNK